MTFTVPTVWLVVPLVVLIYAIWLWLVWIKLRPALGRLRVRILARAIGRSLTTEEIARLRAEGRIPMGGQQEAFRAPPIDVEDPT